MVDDGERKKAMALSTTFQDGLCGHARAFGKKIVFILSEREYKWFSIAYY